MTSAHRTRREPRGCDVCGSFSVVDLHEQRFAAFADGSGLDGYVVVACSVCGFVFADDLPDQSVFDRYYRELSKYESHATGGTISAWQAATHRAIVADISERLADRKLRILDVGAATGHLLSLFRAAGYEDVVGFDPSPRCTQLARELYDVRVINTPISEMAFGGERFDLILMSSVLEHLRDLPAVIAGLRALLRPGGALWAEVPDAANFRDYVTSPFQEFSLEHINYFTHATLAAFMARCGLAPFSTWNTVRVVGTMADPAIDGIFVASAGGADANRPYDGAGVTAVREYIARSQQLEDELCDRLSPLADAKTPIIVWGTGSLTLALLTTPRFARCAIVAFVDSNVNYQGKELAGRPILAPADVRGRDETILIVSHSAEQEIEATIRERLGLTNPIVRFGTSTSASSAAVSER
jgi:2-polyprenyl-3-methyl-5-hydroxy-6-metoxy-1,4-benzoquinol methylase